MDVVCYSTLCESSHFILTRTDFLFITNLDIGVCIHLSLYLSILLLTAFVTTLLHNATVDLWVGLTSDSKGHFQWAKAGLLSYTNWAPGEPLDNSGPHHNKTPVLTTLTCQHTCHGFVLSVFLF